MPNCVAIQAEDFEKKAKQGKPAGFPCDNAEKYARYPIVAGKKRRDVREMASREGTDESRWDERYA